MGRWIFVLLVFLPWVSFANPPSFESLSDQDLENIVKEFSANFVHTSASPPTSLGKTFGLEVAAIAGVTESPLVDEISKSIDPNSEVEYLPHAWFLATVSVPMGVSVELNLLPEVDIQDLKMSHTSVGLKWSVTDQFFESLPFDLAIRSYYTKSEISYRQSVSDPVFPATSQVDVSYENTMVGGDVMLGFDLSMAEPYAGVGFVNTKGKLAGRSTTSSPYSLFDDTNSQEKESNQDSMRVIAGVALHLTALNVSVEYSRIFDTNRYSAKLGLQF